ncbi:MAG TPA: hypothetical protein DEF45_11510 [Rhodopirellula sp.]|nr:hypothetical protein [Rhodopirellula sp.]
MFAWLFDTISRSETPNSNFAPRRFIRSIPETPLTMVGSAGVDCFGSLGLLLSSSRYVASAFVVLVSAKPTDTNGCLDNHARKTTGRVVL